MKEQKNNTYIHKDPSAKSRYREGLYSSFVVTKRSCIFPSINGIESGITSLTVFMRNWPQDKLDH